MFIVKESKKFRKIIRKAKKITLLLYNKFILKKANGSPQIKLTEIPPWCLEEAEPQGLRRQLLLTEYILPTHTQKPSVLKHSLLCPDCFLRGYLLQYTVWACVVFLVTVSICILANKSGNFRFNVCLIHSLLTPNWPYLFTTFILWLLYLLSN